MLTGEEQNDRNLTREEYKNWSLHKETLWRQKSRELWLKEGDRNTNFFHKMANAHRRRDQLAKIRINGCWATEEREIKEGVVQAFQVLLSETGEWRPIVNGLSFKVSGNQDAAYLEVLFSEEEVFTALSDLNGDKAQGPDGFPMTFW